MNNQPECIPCCLQRVLHTAGLVTDDEWLHRKILADAMQELSRADELATPAELIFTLSQRTAKTLGLSTPFADEKRRWIEETTANADLVRAAVDGSPDPFVTALKFSLAANLIDCELRENIVRGFSLKSMMSEVESLSLNAEAVEEFREAVARASSILFVHDTAGELFLDTILIEKMGKPPEACNSVVREGPVLGDATVEDALAAGLDRVARLTDPGISCLGLPLNACSQSFREEYRAADLIIAKGQAAYETLEGQDAQIDGEAREVFFLLRVKCRVMARQLGVEVGDCVVEAN
jgi:uncharacterized protein with ATP-grasp and redox domains